MLFRSQETREIIKYFKEESIDPIEINPFLESICSSPITQKVKMYGVLTRPIITLPDFINHSSKVRVFMEKYNSESIEQAEILMKYEGYISKESEMAEKLIRLEGIELHEDFNYKQLTSLSNEAREKLSKVKPRTIGQAGRISGITPSDLSILMIYLGR